MRFLVFNLVVLLSIGYLFTAAPGQSVGSWLDDTIDTISKVASDTAEPDIIQKPQLALPTKPMNGNAAGQDVSAGAKSPQPVAQQLVSPAPEDQITVEKIQKIINDSISTNLQQIARNLQPSARVAAPSKMAKAGTSSPQTQSDIAAEPMAKKISPDTAVLDNPKIAAQPNKDEALAKAFRELYPAEVKAAAATKSVPSAEAAPSSLAFMTPSDRQSALSELIQNLQLTYVSRVGD